MTLSTSDILTVISILVTVVALAWAIYERASATSARKEVAKFRRLLISQQIAQQFANAPSQALQLFRAVRTQDWESSAELALLLTANLAGLNGAQKHLVGRLDVEALGTVLSVLAELNRYLPRTAQTIEDEMLNSLVDSCNVVLLSVTALERSLSTSAALGGDYDGKLTDFASPDGSEIRLKD